MKGFTNLKKEGRCLYINYCHLLEEFKVFFKACKDFMVVECNCPYFIQIGLKQVRPGIFLFHEYSSNIMYT